MLATMPTVYAVVKYANSCPFALAAQLRVLQEWA
jgi:hypothetical protein